jgi:tRNA(Ile)-lysidine synthase
MIPAPELLDRFRRDMAALVAPDASVGIAVSGGPDSLALLLLAAAERPGRAEAATVDHGLRPESRDEAEMVAGICKRVGVPHRILTAEWADKPETAVQERAREERYRLLGRWVRERGLRALVTAHHLDDQAETFVMRLARGAGVQGLGAMRRVVPAPGSVDQPLLRPLLAWRRAELERLCAEMGISPVEDPSNSDERFERVRVRRALAECDWLDPTAIAISASHLADADIALNWAAAQEWERSVTVGDGKILYRPTNAPREIRRRIVLRALSMLGTEGDADRVRGIELERLLHELGSGKQTTLRGVLCSGGEEWRFVPAPNRTRRADNLR